MFEANVNFLSSAGERSGPWGSLQCKADDGQAGIPLKNHQLNKWVSPLCLIVVKMCHRIQYF